MITDKPYAKEIPKAENSIVKGNDNKRNEMLVAIRMFLWIFGFPIAKRLFNKSRPQPKINEDMDKIGNKLWASR